MSITLIHPAPDSGWAGQRLDGIIKQALPGREVRTVNRAEELSGPWGKPGSIWNICACWPDCGANLICCAAAPPG